MIAIIALVASIVIGVAIRSFAPKPPSPPRPDVRVTIPEGLRREHIATLLEQKGIVDAVSFLVVANHPPESLRRRFAWLTAVPTDQGLEGMLFGDSYRLYPSSRAESVAARLLENFEQKIINNYFPTANTSFYSDLILSSIVEMEVPTARDRQHVADIFKKRLKSGIPLQADSTVNYITGKRTPRASAEDIVIASPYNTYRNRGLPPGPISNPSEASISAVVRSLPNDYYFFLTDESGGVHYARTFQEHQRNRQKYLR